MAKVPAISGVFIKSNGKGSELATASQKDLGLVFGSWAARKSMAVKNVILLVSLCILSVASVGAQTSSGDDPWLKRLVGNWILEGRIADRDTTHDVSGEWVLNHLYVRLHETSREKDAKGQPEYEAIVYVTRDTTPGKYAALWLDNTASGAFAPEGTGHARPQGDSLPFVFSDNKGVVSFKNTFIYDPASGSWRWIMDNVDKGVTKPFGRVTLRKP